MSVVVSTVNTFVLVHPTRNRRYSFTVPVNEDDPVKVWHYDGKLAHPRTQALPVPHENLRLPGVAVTNSI